MNEQHGTSERLSIERPDAATAGAPAARGASMPVRPYRETGESESAISWEKEGDVTIIRFNSDEIKETVYTAQASKELKHFAVRNGGKVLLSLDNVWFLSSVGIAALVAFHRGLRLVGGQLKLCGVRPTVAAVLGAAGLFTVFDIHDSEVDALRAFQLSPQ